METAEAPEIATTAQRKLPGPAMEDRISYLPDEILSHILSFLQTKHAVGTSVLSRRWKDVWTGVYNLDLDHKNRYYSFEIAADWHEVRERRYLEFCRFAERVLSQHKNLNSLRRFRFHFPMNHAECKTMPNFWLKMGLAPDESQLEEMDVKLEGGNWVEDPFSMRWLPESFYRLKNLKILKLEGVTIDTTTKCSVFLPSVEVLQLMSVLTKDCASLSKLVSGCPVLETLHMELCDSSNGEENDKLIAFLPYLKKLTIIGISFHNNPLRSIVIEAPSLEQLYLEEFPEMQLLDSSCPLPCLRSATVELGDSQISNQGLTRVLAQISNAKEMRLSWSILCLLSNDNDGVQLPIFPNLTRLTIGSPGSRCILHYLLNSVPKLQSLVIDLEDGRGRMEWEDSDEPACTLECLLSSLEEIKIENLIADEDEMELVAYLLEAGVSLKKAHVHIIYDDADIYEEYGDYLKSIRNRLGSLVKLLRSSRDCEAHLFLPDGDEILAHSDDETDGNDDVDGMDVNDTNDDNDRTENDNDDVIGDGNDGEKSNLTR